MSQIERINLRVALSRELGQFEEKVTQMRRQAEGAPLQSKDAILEDAAAIERHVNVLRDSLAELG